MAQAIENVITRNNKAKVIKLDELTSQIPKRNILHIAVDISGSMSSEYQKLYDILCAIQLKIGDIETYISYIGPSFLPSDIASVRTLPELIKLISERRSTMFNTLTMPDDTIDALKYHHQDFIASIIITDGELSSSVNEFYNTFKKVRVPQIQYIIFANTERRFDGINQYMKNIIINSDTFISVFPTLNGFDSDICTQIDEPLQALDTNIPKNFGKVGQYHIIKNYAIPAKCSVEDLVEEFKVLPKNDIDMISSIVINTLSALDDTNLDGLTWFDTIQRALCRVDPQFNRILSSSNNGNMAQVLREIRQEEMYEKNSEYLEKAIDKVNISIVFDVDDLQKILNQCMNAPNPKILIDALKNPHIVECDDENRVQIRIPVNPTPQALMASCRLMLGSYRKILSMRHGMGLLFHMLGFNLENLEKECIHDAIKFYADEYIKSVLDTSGKFLDIAYNGEIMRTIGKLVNFLKDNSIAMNYAKAMRTIAHARDISNILSKQKVEFKDQIDIFTPLDNNMGVFVEIHDYEGCDNIPHIGVVRMIEYNTYRIYYFDLDEPFGHDRWTYSRRGLNRAIKDVIGIVPLDDNDYIGHNNRHLQKFKHIAVDYYRQQYDGENNKDVCREKLINGIKNIEGFHKVGTLMRNLTSDEVSNALCSYSDEYATLPINLYERSGLENWLFNRQNDPRVVQVDANIADAVNDLKVNFKPLELRIGLHIQKIEFEECDICMEIKGSLITKCPNKHFCCNECWMRLDRCPFCRSILQ